MKNKTSFIALIAIFFIISQIIFVSADGGYFPRPGYWVYPGQQKAIILHEDNTETMILTSNFRGNAKDLVWIIPTPTKPEVTKANEEIFNNIARLTQQRYDYGYGYGAMMKAAVAETSTGVVVIESKKVDYYDVKVLLATSSDELVKWFKDNDYDYLEDYSYVLNYYIQKGWYFTAIKISPESQNAVEIMQDLKEGHPTPVKLVFLSDKIVFPLKISSIEFKPKDEKKYGSATDEPIGATRKDENGNVWTKTANNSYGNLNWCIFYDGEGNSCTTDYQIDTFPGGINYRTPYYESYTPIQLYIIADGKYEAKSNFYVDYGNWVNAKKITELGEDENGNPLLNPKKNKYFLTSLSANLQKSQMDDDIFFKKAEDNKKVNAGPETWQLFLYGIIIALLVSVTWIFTPLGIMFIAGCLILFFAINQTARIFAWVIQIFSFIATLIIGLIFIIMVFTSGSWNYAATSVVVTYIIFLIIMVLLIILEVKYKNTEVKYKR